MTPLIINIAGTNGSGKSTVVSSLLNGHDLIVMRKGSHITGYKVECHGGPIQVIGAYERPTGGCDTLKSPELAFDLIRKYAEQNDRHVLYEGAFVMHQITGPILARTYPGRYVVLLLTTPLALCVQAINQRRKERGEPPINNVANVETNWRRSHHYAAKMQAAGAKVVRVTREAALGQLLELLATS